MNYIKIMIFGALFTSTAAHAAQAPQASGLTCPATISAGAPLSGITGIVSNNDCNNPLTIQSKVLSIIGNSGGLQGASGGGSVGLQGPFVKPLANGLNALIPEANCSVIPYNPGHPEWGTYTVVTPAKTTLAFNFATAAFPANTLIVVSAGVIDNNNHLSVIGACPITVVP